MNSHSSHISDHDTHTLATVDIDGANLLVTQRYRKDYVEKEYEPFTKDLFRLLLKETDTFIDIGAHLGFFTVMAAQKARLGRVFAFEPIAENFELLTKNVHSNNFKDVKLQQLAISDVCGQMEFNHIDASGSPGFSDHLLSHTIENNITQTASLDSLFGNEEIDFIRIDTEGHEISALDGMKDVLRYNPNLKLIVKMNPLSLSAVGHLPQDLLGKLVSSGFNVFFIDDEERKLYRYDPDAPFFDRIYYQEDHVNLLCLPRSNSLFVSFMSHSSLKAGAEKSLLELINGLLARGVLCHVLLPSDGPIMGDLLKLPVSVSVVPYRWWTVGDDENKSHVESALARSSEAVIRDLYWVNPQLVFTNTGVINIGAVSSRALGIPHIWCISEHGEIGLGLSFTMDISQRSRYINEYSDHVIFVSQSVKKYFNDHAGLDYGEVVYAGVKLNQVPSHDVSYFSSVSSTKLLVLGSIRESKGQLDAVQAIIKLLRTGMNLELVVAGYESSPSYADQIRELIEIEGAHDRIRILSFVENPVQLISQSDIMLMCSRNEAFGRVTLEAMQLSKPVIGASSGGTLELIKDGWNGLLYEAGNVDELAEKIARLHADIDLRQQLGQHGHDFAQSSFPEDAYPQRTYEILHQCIERHQRRYAGLNDRTLGLAIARSSEQDDFSIPMPYGQLYLPTPGGYCEEASQRAKVEPHRWVKLAFAIDPIDANATVPIRFDPIDRVGMVEIRNIRLVSELDGSKLWQAISSTDYDAVFITGSAVRLPDPELLRIFSHGADCQVFLPKIGDIGSSGTLRLEVELRIDLLTTSLADIILKARKELEDARSELDASLTRIGRMSQALADSVAQLELVKKHVQSMQSSWSWRLTWPVRLVHRFVVSCFSALVIFKSGVFDPEYYRNSNPDLGLFRFFPLFHYVWIGWQEQRNPSPTFDAQRYTQQHPEAALAGMSPLLHRIRQGPTEGPTPSSSPSENRRSGGHQDLTPPSLTSLIQRALSYSSAIAPATHARECSVASSCPPPQDRPATRNVAVVIPVYNNWPVVEKCLESCAQHIEPKHQILIFNDHSQEPLIEEKILDFIADKPNFQYHFNLENLGFVKTCNRAISMVPAGNDLLLLNSDTVVTPGFLDEMLACLYLSDRHAACCPRSNSATIFTIPPKHSHPQNVDFAAISHACWIQMRDALPRFHVVPTAVGFCMLIKRSIISNFGLFDEIYGRGYNEENDFCCRLNRLGYSVVACNRAYVFHFESASFTQRDKQALERRNRDILCTRYPEYPSAVFSYIRWEMDPRDHFADLLGGCYARKRILYDLSRLIPLYNGTTEYALSLLSALAPMLRSTYDLFISINSKADSAFNISARYPNVIVNDTFTVSQHFDIAFTPYQIFEYENLFMLNRVALRYIINILDMISVRSFYLRQKDTAAIFKTAIRYANGLLSISRTSLNDALSYFILDSTNISQLRSSILLTKDLNSIIYNRTPSDIEKSISDSLPSNYILIVGNHYHHKVVHLCADSIGPEWPVVILGIKPTSDDDDINRLVYIQTGNLSEQAVQHIYQHAKIIIFPSLYEGFGFPTLEAASYSKPLVLFNSDVNHEIVDAFNLQDNTFFFNTFRELPSILTEINSLDRTHASRISRTWADVARETFSFIEAVLSVPVDLKNLTDRYTHITNLELHDTQW